MFTVAHTITFSLAGLEILPLPPSKLVESDHRAVDRGGRAAQPEAGAVNKEWLIAFCFGLFHGMGFASLVEGLDVDQEHPADRPGRAQRRHRDRPDGGGAADVPARLFLLRRTRYFRPFFTVTSVGFALVSVGWMIERVFEKDLRSPEPSIRSSSSRARSCGPCCSPRSPAR